MRKCQEREADFYFGHNGSRHILKLRKGPVVGPTGKLDRRGCIKLPQTSSNSPHDDYYAVLKYLAMLLWLPQNIVMKSIHP